MLPKKEYAGASSNAEEIKVTLQGLTKGQKKRIKTIYGSCSFHSMPKDMLRTIWNNPEVQKWITQK